MERYDISRLAKHGVQIWRAKPIARTWDHRVIDRFRCAVLQGEDPGFGRRRWGIARKRSYTDIFVRKIRKRSGSQQTSPAHFRLQGAQAWLTSPPLALRIKQFTYLVGTCTHRSVPTFPKPYKSGEVVAPLQSQRALRAITL